MRKLLDYLNSLEPPAQKDFADRCKTTVGYLRKAISAGQRISAQTCIDLERESGGVVLCEDVRADVDWAFLRNSRNRLASAVPSAASQPAERGAQSAQGAAHG